MSDNAEKIDHPAYYQAANDPVRVYECVKVIEAWGLSFCLGNALKYICRAGKKPGVDAAEDLEKCVWYVRHEIERLKREGSA